MDFLLTYKDFILESVKPDEVEKTLTRIEWLRKQGKSIGTASKITWLEPTDDYIKEEIYEFPENLKTVWIEKNDKIKELFPESLKVLDNLLGSSTEINNKIKNQFKDKIEVQKEIIDIVKSGKMVDWTNNISQTGNMGTLKNVTKYGVDKEIKSDGEGGILEFIDYLKTLDDSKKLDLVNYLPSYVKLLESESGVSEEFAPFVVNISHEEGKPYHCIGGHKRSTISNQLGIPLKVWLIEFQ